jgi:hypothetical protein
MTPIGIHPMRLQLRIVDVFTGRPAEVELA